jgi:hypothetical protein
MSRKSQKIKYNRYLIFFLNLRNAIVQPNALGCTVAFPSIIIIIKKCNLSPLIFFHAASLLSSSSFFFFFVRSSSSSKPTMAVRSSSLSKPRPPWPPLCNTYQKIHKPRNPETLIKNYTTLPTNKTSICTNNHPQNTHQELVDLIKIVPEKDKKSEIVKGFTRSQRSRLKN